MHVGYVGSDVWQNLKLDVSPKWVSAAINCLTKQTAFIRVSWKINTQEIKKYSTLITARSKIISFLQRSKIGP